MAKRKAKRAVKSNAQYKKISLMPISKKIDLVIKNFIIFLVLSIISFILYNLIPAGFWNDLFFLFLFVFGFVSLAFLMLWLVLRMLKK
jgi:hypothetical protein